MSLRRWEWNPRGMWLSASSESTRCERELEVQPVTAESTSTQNGFVKSGR